MLWDFSVATTISALVRTWPFIIARMIVYGAISLAYVFVTGIGATVGWGVGALGTDDFQAGATVVGGIAGFAIVSAFLYFIREWILYMVKAGHIAMLVEVLDGGNPPGGMAQVGAARAIVQARFAEANVLFVIDQLVKGVIRVVAGIVDFVAAILPVPGLEGLARFVRAVVRVAIGFVDEVILAHNIQVRSENPYATAQDALVLYAQNAVWILKNAVWLAAMVWGLAFVMFLIFLAPAAAVVYLLPGTISGFGFVFAIIFALCLKAAVLEPFAIASLMQVYFRATEGQTPRQDWRAHLEEVSGQFRELGEKARDFVRTPDFGRSDGGPGTHPDHPTQAPPPPAPPPV
ncbi:hypothetical protein [Microbaculum marinum]|uniref:DUF4282 domain-containing protein n=1 Tax=Microbaculum marinum TaxID=1764581 RepID=A0AAW9RKC3_9HYPH